MRISTDVQDRGLIHQTHTHRQRKAQNFASLAQIRLMLMSSVFKRALSAQIHSYGWYVCPSCRQSEKLKLGHGLIFSMALFKNCL